ncbi:MAG TPA: 1-deoxy-D-xylulose-5-phosphate synthase, partial [Chitinophagaceae bacterium]|nr:1-deoxy-D-xylulose-5-phosphate synthase [Chitinophagaceae bacterium]
LNHAGVSDTNLLVILNDNCMSIDPNVGALKDYLSKITTSSTFNKFRDDVWKILGKLPLGKNKSRDIASKVETALKGMVSKGSNLFEALNMRYFGPIDGNNIDKMVDALEAMKTIPGPKLLHVHTIKGKGFEQAEKDQTTWHAPGLFDKVTGKIKKVNTGPHPPKFQDVFGHSIIELARKNKDIMGITPAMPSGSSLKYMMKEMPDRALDVGICEQHAVTVSAGLATRGMRVFCTIYSTFMQRGYDQIVHDVAIQDLPVIFCLDRAGLVGKDGATHQGLYDIAYLRCIPNMIVSAPMDEPELRNLMFTAQLPEMKHPIAIRYPRGKGVTVEWHTPFEAIPIGKGRLIQEGNEVAILSYGHSGNFVVEATQTLHNEGLYPAHYDMRFVKPLDKDLLHHVFTQFDKVITIEEGIVNGGFGSAILEWANENNYHHNQIKILGIHDKIIRQGNPEEQRREAKVDAAAIIETVEALTGAKITHEQNI